MCEKKEVFPDNEYVFYESCESITGNTNFSYMGEHNGIEIKFIINYKRIIANTLMNPDWEEIEFSDKFKNMFLNGYYVFEEEKIECVEYHALVDYDKEQEAFNIKTIKRKGVNGFGFINYISKEFTREAIETFEVKTLESIMAERIKKLSF